MKLEPHQQRVMQEMDELDVKLRDLQNFIRLNPMFKGLGKEEQALLCTQSDLMNDYSNVLYKRLKLWGVK
jgi:hypothetical protein